jgi:hypothetical protein
VLQPVYGMMPDAQRAQYFPQKPHNMTRTHGVPPKMNSEVCFCCSVFILFHPWIYIYQFELKFVSVSRWQFHGQCACSRTST